MRRYLPRVLSRRHRPPQAAASNDESHKSKYARLSAEADREQTNHSGRRSSNNSRATTLVGAASIGASVSATSHGWLGLGAGLMFLATAVIGVVVLWPKRGPGLDIGPLFDNIWTTSAEKVELTLLQVKLKVLAADEESLLRAARLVRAGMVCILVAIALLAGHAGALLTPWKDGAMSEPTQKPPTQTGPPREPDPAFVQMIIKESGKPTNPPSARPPEKKG